MVSRRVQSCQQWQTLCGLSASRAEPLAQASEAELGRDVHAPVELGQQALVEDLLHGHLVLLAPGHGDARVQVVDLGGAQRHGLQILLHPGVDLQLGQRLPLALYLALQPA